MATQLILVSMVVLLSVSTGALLSLLFPGIGPESEPGLPGADSRIYARAPIAPSAPIWLEAPLPRPAGPLEQALTLADFALPPAPPGAEVAPAIGSMNLVPPPALHSAEELARKAELASEFDELIRGARELSPRDGLDHLGASDLRRTDELTALLEWVRERRPGRDPLGELRAALLDSDQSVS